jgi:hypothetical protein
LRQRIIEACNAITPGIIKRVFLDWVKRLNLCIENNGGHTEQVLQIKAFVLPLFIFFL